MSYIQRQRGTIVERKLNGIKDLKVNHRNVVSPVRRACFYSRTILCLRNMWFLGHFALGYFSGYAASKVTRERMILPVVWFASMLPDLDLLLSRYMVHRGPTHSIVLAVIAFIPVFLVFRRGFPYFAALISHSLIGDYFVPPTQMFWPQSDAWFGAPPGLQLTGVGELLIEVGLFALMAIIIIFRRRNV